MMFDKYHITYRIFLLFSLLLASPVFAEEDNNGNIAKVQGIPEMNARQRQSMGIVTSTVFKRKLYKEIIAPGDVGVNIYLSSQISTRIRSQVIKRYARVGDNVTAGQILLTLSSVSMANAQSEMLIADREWKRVKKLGRKVVSEQRFVEAQVNRQQAHAKALAYGITEAQIAALLKQGDASKATGMFNLLSIQNGTIISDNFLLGQVVEPGQLLMEISDESQLWAETQINPHDVRNIQVGTPARIEIDKELWIPGKVIQIHRLINETTRTLPVRVEVNNEQGLLRPGQFVKVALQTTSSHEVIATPRSAVTLLQGEHVVFVLKGNTFFPQLVAIGETRGDWVEVKNGLKTNDEIVIKGVFVLKSLLLKSQIGDTD